MTAHPTPLELLTAIQVFGDPEMPDDTAAATSDLDVTPCEEVPYILRIPGTRTLVISKERFNLWKEQSPKGVLFGYKEMEN